VAQVVKRLPSKYEVLSSNPNTTKKKEKREEGGRKGGKEEGREGGKKGGRKEGREEGRMDLVWLPACIALRL
jgi:flagellar biosynthesis/type III secretory pathway protein FliH